MLSVDGLTEYRGTGLTSAWFESLADPVLICERDDKTIVAANGAAAERLLGVPAAQLAGRAESPMSFTRCPARLYPPVTASGRMEWRCELHAPGGRAAQ